MRALIGIALLLAVALPGAVVAGAAEAETEVKPLQAGDKAPLFETVDHEGKKRQLKDHLGKQWVILSFYVIDDTGG